MEEKLQEVERKFQELTELLSDPVVLSDNDRLTKYAKARADLETTVTMYHEWLAVTKQLKEAKDMLQTESDSEMREMAQMEVDELSARETQLDADLKVALLPKDPNDNKDVILEVRGGAGGEESSLFAGDLLRMYQRYAALKGWKVEAMSLNETDLGGVKEAAISIRGEGVYRQLKYESGVHRVQRVPATEAQGRIHTSTATVAIMPEAEEVDIEIHQKDLKIDTFRSGGAGGQNVNKVETAVRITHIPSGEVVACQEERSQLQNRMKAMNYLRARLLAAKEEKAHAERSELRKSQVGTGDRSERIRTYNFSENRVTDHRIKVTLHKLDAILNGDMDELVGALIHADNQLRLEQMTAQTV
ncbi:MAG: peptide chain release factor 1 [Candidatus Sericytochromatia bacterium]